MTTAFRRGAGTQSIVFTSILAFALQSATLAAPDLPPDPWVNANGQLRDVSSHKDGLSSKQQVEELAAALDCSKAIDMAELGACTGNNLERLDQRLNAVYEALLAVYDDVTAKRFRAAECAWLKYRDAQCAFEVEPEAAGFYRGACLQRATSARLAQLYELAAMDNGPQRK